MRTGLGLCYFRNPRFQNEQIRFGLPNSKSVIIQWKDYLLLIFPSFSLGLGVWQFRRHGWKTKLIQEIEAQISKEPISLPKTREEIEALEYVPVKVKGRFNYEKEILIGPRSLITSDSSSSRGLISSYQKNGFHVITPFVISGETRRILVNRGWISTEASRNSKSYGSENFDEIEVIGLPRRNEKTPSFMPKNKTTETIWHYRNIDALAETLNTEPIFIDALINKDSQSPIGGQTIVTLRNEHFSYMLTWFSLSALTYFLWIQRYVLR